MSSVLAGLLAVPPLHLLLSFPPILPCPSAFPLQLNGSCTLKLLFFLSLQFNSFSSVTLLAFLFRLFSFPSASPPFPSPRFFLPYLFPLLYSFFTIFLSSRLFTFFLSSLPHFFLSFFLPYFLLSFFISSSFTQSVFHSKALIKGTL